MARLAAVVAVGAALFAAPGSARADEFSLHVLFDGQTAVTSNAFSAPEGGEGASSASLNYQIRPGALFSYHSRRALHELSGEIGIDGNDFTDNLTLTFRGGWRLQYTVSERATLDAGVAASGGRVNALATFAPANMGQPGVLPTGLTDFYSVDANQGLGYELTPLWTVREGAFGRYLATDSEMLDTSGWQAGLDLGADRAFRMTAVGVSVGGSFQRLANPTATAEPLDQLDARGALRVRRDFSAQWSGAVEAGVDALFPLRAGDELHVEPVGGVDLGYFPAWGSAALSVRHAAAPNLFLAQNQVTDSATVNAALPLPWLARSRAEPTLVALGSVGYAHTRFLDLAEGGFLASFDSVYSDVAVQYQPDPGTQYALRYQLVIQSDADTTSTDPMLAMLGYVRHTVMATVALRWPSRVAAELPIRNQIRARDLESVGGADTAIRGGGGAGGGGGE